MKTKSRLPKKMEYFPKKITSHGTLDKYLCCDNTGQHQSKLQKACTKEKVTLEYTAPHTPHTNGFIERRFAIIK